MPPDREYPAPTPDKPTAHLSFGAVIVAAGRGERAGFHAGGPKQYRDLCGEPVIARTLDAFIAWDATMRIVIVIHGDDKELLREALGDLPSNVTACTGGSSRQASVLCGLRALAAEATPPTHVMIHDAARPFVSAALLRRIADAAHANPGSGILPAIPVSETLKAVDDEGAVLRTVPRDGLQRAQTPQTFPLPEIVDLHDKAAAAGLTDFTDDAALFEWAGVPVCAIEGDSRNMKLTYNADFEEAARMLNEEYRPPLPDVRVGHGYDTHQLVAGDKVILCGVEIPHDRRLSGHSDADVGLHALTDALLATIGAGDIGDHFPPSDPQWKGASSDQFLDHAARLVENEGGTVTNCDVTIICESPKIAPHREVMREAISAILGIELRRVSVKATTNEKIGFIGREEGIVALATATAVFEARETQS